VLFWLKTVYYLVFLVFAKLGYVWPESATTATTATITITLPLAFFKFANKKKKNSPPLFL
jgi:hypothetical protein